MSPAPFPFDAVRALKYLHEICRIGPRISGTSGMDRQREYLRAHFEPLCDRFAFQKFSTAAVPMANLVASWGLEHHQRVLLCAHYDTRPIADREPDRNDWHRPFLGANDGASGVALLMELARHLRSGTPGIGVDIVLFDGEEYIFDPENDLYFLGSTHFAEIYQAGRWPEHYLGAILLDMVAGRDAEFPVEAFSADRAGELAGEVWGIAEEQGCPAFIPEIGQCVMDDHLPLNLAGIPTVVIIDSCYSHWHKLTDTPEQCCAETLAEVARVVIGWLVRNQGRGEVETGQGG